ncbi:MAG: SidA/IucD/PvdA family monooxygenase [Albidovulum sp.]|uniref:SidA/IucD/PvdA family monooxygenase n=1 Tax=Albidovulum sp. TaxID=1872424 RepID=UPI003CA645A7
MHHIVHDIVGVGFGPGNIALAIALEEQFPHVNAIYLEARTDSRWQANMMIVNADIQHNPHMDLATPRNPQSYYSFNNFLHKTGRMFRHHNLGLEFPLRQEYSDYVLWAAERFADKVAYNTRASQIRITTAPNSTRPVYEVTSSDGRVFYGRCLVIAHGRPPFVPDTFADLPQCRCVHLNEYKSSIDARGGGLSSVAVIGASQSAVEIILDLTERFPHLAVTNYVRHFGYRQKDLSPQMEASIYPENVEAFYNRTWAQRQQFNDDLKYQNYSSADIDVLKEINLRSYVKKLNTGRDLLTIHNNSRITDVTTTGSKVRINSEQIYTGDTVDTDVDLVILATGFRDLGPGPNQDRIPSLLTPLQDEFDFDDHGVVSVSLDYRLQSKSADTPAIFLNGLCEGTHGVSDAGSFSLLALRTEKIAMGIEATLYDVPASPKRAAAPEFALVKE